MALPWVQVLGTPDGHFNGLPVVCEFELQYEVGRACAWVTLTPCGMAGAWTARVETDQTRLLNASPVTAWVPRWTEIRVLSLLDLAARMEGVEWEMPDVTTAPETIWPLPWPWPRFFALVPFVGADS